MKKLRHAFFRRDPRICARELIGCEIVWDRCAGIIVETEAYSVVNDEACHTFMRPSARSFVATHPVGSAYVYLNYGVHWLLNVLVKGGAEDGFVLLRALQPTRGIPLMQKRRKMENERSLCSGPGKLSQALGVLGSDHGVDLCQHSTRFFCQSKEPVEVVTDIRIGISKAAHLEWRYLLAGSSFVSVAPSRHSERSEGSRSSESA